MRGLMNFIGTLVNIYLLLIFIRVILSWAQGAAYGKFYDFLCTICDPYLNWFRRFQAFRTPTVDFSPIIAMAVLALVSNIFYTIAAFGYISVGIILAMVLSAVWSFVSFILGFLIILLILQLISFSTKRDVYNGFWRVVDLLSQPVLYRINSALFKFGTTDSNKCIGLSILVLAVIMIVLGIAVVVLKILFLRLPF